MLIGEELDEQVRHYVTYLRERGCIVNTHVVIGVGEGIVMGQDPTLLARNGGGILLTKDWAMYVMKRMG